MIEFEKVCAGYGKKQVLNNISLSFEKGSITTIIGPNGCGKSTLLKSAVGLCEVFSGNIIIDNKNADSITKQQRAQRIAYLSQGKNLPETTVGLLVLHGRFPYLSFPRKYSKADFEKAKLSMEKMGILQYKDTRLCELSGGIRQKAYIAMALCQEADTILFDEPTTYLDISQQFKMNDIFCELKQSGKAVVCVLHDIVSALKISDKIIVMSDGKVIKTGTPSEIVESGVISKVFGVEVYSHDNEYFYKQKGIF